MIQLSEVGDVWLAADWITILSTATSVKNKQFKLLMSFWNDVKQWDGGGRKQCKTCDIIYVTEGTPKWTKVRYMSFGDTQKQLSWSVGNDKGGTQNKLA